MLSAENTEELFETLKVELKTPEKPKYKPCIGKAYGYSCKTCAVRSYCDGIPEIKPTKH